MPTMRSLQFSTNCTATHLNEDPHDILQTRFVKTLFSNFDNFSHIAPEQGLSWGLLNYEADLRGEGQGLLALARNKSRANLPRKMFKPVLILEMNLLRKVVHNGGDSFGWLLIQEWILVLQSFRESSFSGKPASFVTKVAVFYWQACKVSGGGNSATELKPNVKKWKVSYGRIARFLEGNSAKECWWWLNVKVFLFEGLLGFWRVNSATNHWWWWLKLNVKSFVREGKVKQGLVALKDEQQERRRLFSGKKK